MAKFAVEVGTVELNVEATVVLSAEPESVGSSTGGGDAGGCVAATVVPACTIVVAAGAATAAVAGDHKSQFEVHSNS